MTNPRSRVFAGLAAAAVVASMGACAGQGTTPEGSADAAASGPVKLSFWHGMTGPDGPAVQQIVDDFNASQSEVVVEPNVMPWDQLYDKLLTSLTGTGGPQIVAMDSSRIPQYAQAGALAPTDDFYSGTTYVEASVLPEAVKTAGVYDGVNYAAPFNVAPMMLYWNKDLFTKAGLDPDTPPATWDEFKEMAAKLTVDENKDGKPEQYAIALPDHETIPVYQSLLWNDGGGVVSEDGKTSLLDTPESLRALSFWTDLVRQGKVSPVGLSGADADKLFQTGKAAMEIVGPWMTTGFEEAGIDFGLARPFAGPTDRYTLANAVSFTVNAKDTDAQKQAAYTFFAYWNSVEGQVTWANGSGFPPVRTDVPAEKLTNKYSATFGDKDLLESAKLYLPGVPAAGTITDTIFNPAMQKVLNGDGTVEEVFTQASKDVQAELDKS